MPSRPPEFSAIRMSSTDANKPNPSAMPKLCCRFDTPRNRENSSKNRIKPHCTMRTERCRVVIAWIKGSLFPEFENATTTETRSITTPVHLNSTVPRSLSV